MPTVRSPFSAAGRVFTVGQVVPDDDPILVGREALFADAPRVLERDAATVTTSPLDDLTKSELLDLAAERDIEGRSSMTKAELVDALRS